MPMTSGFSTELWIIVLSFSNLLQIPLILMCQVVNRSWFYSSTGLLPVADLKYLTLKPSSSRFSCHFRERPMFYKLG